MESADNSFGPFFHTPGQYTFDFTLLFEDTILSILPSSLLLLATLLRVLQLWRSSQKVKISQSRTIKMTLLLGFTALQVANLIVWALEPTHQTSASVAAASLTVAVTFGLFGLSTFEHSRSIHPSFLINAYLLVTLLLDAAKVRTLWLRAGTVATSSIASTSLAVKSLLLVVEAAEKRRLLLPLYTHHPPESTSSLYARGVFWWLNPVFLTGFRNVLQECDLFHTQEKLTAVSLSERFHSRWARRSKMVGRYQLITTMARCMFVPLTAAILPRLCQTFFRFMQPLLIRRVTSFVDLPGTQSATDEGWGLTGAYGLVYIGIAISVAMFNYQAYRVAAMIRGALVTAIYNKTMALSVTALDEAAAVTLMSTDVQRLSDAMPFIHELWACPLEIAIAIWLLAGELGLALLGPVFVSILAVLLVSAVASRMASAQKDWLAEIQARVSVTAKSLQTMKSIKMLGLTSVVTNVVECLRKSEIRLSLRSRRLMAYSIICGNVTDIFAPGTAFAIYVTSSHYNGQQLTASSAYTIMSLISLLANPTKVLINFAIPQVMIAVCCFDRIQTYLLSTSRRDDRLFAPTIRQSDSTSGEEIALDRIELNIKPVELKTLSTKTRQPSNAIVETPSLRAVNCTLFWKDSTQPVINDVSFELYAGLTMLVGKVGCGKTSLIKGLLGEIQSTKGHIFLESEGIAFVDQSPWIYHGSLRENIVGVSLFEHEFYSKVIHACALDEDFENIAQGDNTQVGSAGSGLSGGQKLRVALARAIYSQKQILVLDDVFSGLDPTAEDRIFSRLLGKRGFLRDLNMTVVLVTHAAHRLSYADHIIALNEKGSIAEQGSFNELMANGGYTSSLAARHKTEDNTKPKEKAELIQIKAPDSERAVAENDLNRPVGDRAVYKYYFATTGYIYAATFFVSVALFAFLVQFPALWLTFWTNAVSSRGNEVNGGYLGGLLAFNVTAMIVLTCVVFLAYTRMVPRSAIRLHERLLSSVRNAPLFFFTSTETGKVVNRFSQDMNIIDFELPWALVEFAAASCIAIVQAVLICLSAAYFAAIMPVVLVIMYILQKFYLRTSRQIRLIDLEAKSPLYSNFIESLNGLVTIRAFGWTANFEERNLKLLDRSQRPLYMFLCVQRWLNLVLDLTVAGLAVLLMVLIVNLRERLDAGLVGVALLNIMNFNLSLTEVIKQWTTLETSLGAVARVKGFCEETPYEHLPQEDQQPPKSWPGQGAIAFQNVSASYATDGPLVLRDINLSVLPVQKIGLVGHSGSGKSSLVTTLLHMLSVRNGSIVVDGQSMSTAQREEWRQGLSVIPQEPLFIHGSIRANLDPFSRNIRDGSLLSALEKVDLREIIDRAGGLDANLNSEKLLSHGQRQLFSLARAIVNRSHTRILILDEVTASVDMRTDETMQRIIRDEFKEFTIITVAHRLQTVVDYDRILVLNQGRIVEDGAPQDLLANKDSKFRKLWDSS